MIKAVIFDVGGVLLRTEDLSLRQDWEVKLGFEPGRLEAIVLNSEMGHKAQRGEISDAELWNWVGEELALGDQLLRFRADFWAGDVLDLRLMDYIRALRPDYQTAIISNATDDLEDNLSRHQMIDAFDLVIGSAAQGIMKPEPAIYRHTLAQLGREPAEAVFIDDFQHNIAAAEALGIATIHYQPGTDVAAELAALGVAPAATKEA